MSEVPYYTETSVSGFARIPSECVDIAKIRINDKLQRGSKSVQRLLDSGYLLRKFAFLSVPTGADTNQVPVYPKYTPPYSQRGFEGARNKYWDELGNYYTIVTSVGVGPKNITGLDVDQDLHHDKNEPYGLTGLLGRERDWQVTERWIDKGVLTSRAVALLPLKPDPLLSWYKNSFPVSEYNLEKALEIIHKNGDIPVIYVRLLKSKRLAELLEYPDTRMTVGSKLQHGLEIFSEQLKSPASLPLDEMYQLLFVSLLNKPINRWVWSDSFKALKFLGYVYGRSLGIIEANKLDLPFIHAQNLDTAGSIVDAEAEFIQEVNPLYKTKVDIANLNLGPTWLRFSDLMMIQLSQCQKAIAAAMSASGIATTMTKSEQDDRYTKDLGREVALHIFTGVAEGIKKTN